VLPGTTDLFGVKGNAQLDAMTLGETYTTRVESLRDLIEVYDREVTMLEGDIHRRLRSDRGYRAIQAINGIGPTMAAILVAEIGDVTRFRNAAALCSWAGLTPKHRESDTTVHRLEITKQGSRLVRWAVVEGCVRYHGGGKLAADYRRIAERRGKNKATVPSPARSSPSSTTGCETARSAAWPQPRRWRETVRTRPDASSESA
jgi:transposase